MKPSVYVKRMLIVARSGLAINMHTPDAEHTYLFATPRYVIQPAVLVFRARDLRHKDRQDSRLDDLRYPI